jgi:hypothetical protein
MSYSLICPYFYLFHFFLRSWSQYNIQQKKKQIKNICSIWNKEPFIYAQFYVLKCSLPNAGKNSKVIQLYEDIYKSRNLRHHTIMVVQNPLDRRSFQYQLRWISWYWTRQIRYVFLSFLFLFIAGIFASRNRSTLQSYLGARRAIADCAYMSPPYKKGASYDCCPPFSLWSFLSIYMGPSRPAQSKRYH